ncbi:MAG: peptidase-C39 like family protein [Solidesulfovibrio sp.]|uniref:peptidase-C39 like family protein n=1 Tax=Solidesulfovibrio sp. TaxID=2910990 RepID=UPI002B217FDE|nr:peptidase-C39 like family protein [Solidesulfovibrio sp.]MEA4857025.1 peptidase-C39 like family protein [Solidesulfovibrio sp.]
MVSAKPVRSKLAIPIEAQPDDTTCGPTCLQAIYRYYGDDVPLSAVIAETATLPGGGTLAALLGCHALSRGYAARLYTFDLTVFDITWFGDGGQADLADKLTRQRRHKKSARLQATTEATLEYLRLGGEIRFEDLTAGLLRGILKRDRPILAGLSATYLYRTARERDDADGKMIFDDLRGEPSGHFVVIGGYDQESRTAHIADPLLPNPISESQYYQVTLNHLVCAVMLGIITRDANLLVLSPRKKAVPRDGKGAFDRVRSGGH